MRTLIIYSTLLLFVINFAGEPQSYNFRWQVNLPQGNALSDIASLEGNTIIAVGNYGTVLKSTDAGNSWIAPPSGISGNINKIDVINSSILFIHALDVSTNIRKTYKSSDGGMTWELLPNQVTNAYYFDSKFYSQTSGVRVVDGTIQKTTNCGSSWQNLFTGLGSRNKIAFYDSLKYAVYMDYYNYAQTIDGGLTWVWKNFGRTCGFLEIKETVIYALTDLYSPSSIYKSTNDGASWSSIFTVGDKVFRKLSFVDPLVGYALAYSNVYLNDSCDIYKTTNGGVNWQKIYSGEYLNSITSGGSTQILGAGLAGKIVVSIDSGTSWIDNNSNGTDLKSICFPSEATGFVGGIGGKLFKISNNGGVVSKINLNTSKDINCIIFVDSLRGWLAGGEGLLKQTSDGGLTWLDQSTGDANFWAFSFSKFTSTSGQTALVLTGVGTNGWTTFISFNYGNSWVEKISPVSQITCSNNGYFGSGGGRIYFYDETTNSWQLSSSGLVSSIKGIDVYKDANGFPTGMIAIAGDGRVIFKDKNSSTWVLKSNAAFSATGIACNGKGGNVAYGGSGIILSSDSLSANWEPETKITNSDIVHLAFRTLDEFWAIGNDGIIFSGSTVSTLITYLSLDTVPGFKGDTSSIPLSLDSIQSNMMSASLTFSFPPGVSVISIDTTNSLTGEQNWVYSSIINGNSVRIDAGGAKAINTKGVLFKVRFVIADTMQGTLYPVGVGACNFNGGNMPYAISSGAFFPAKRGDVDTNGVVQAYDAALILKNLVGIYPLAKVQLVIADVTKDGTLSDLDAVVVLKYIVGLIDTLPAPGNYLAHGLISFGECTFSSGGIVEVPVKIDDASGLLGLEMTMNFDNKRLELLDISHAGIVSGFSFETKISGGIVKIAGMSLNTVEGCGDILKLKFRVKESSTGSGKISISRVRLNENREEINVAELEINTATSPDDENMLPVKFSMSENYPNPFNPRTKVDFTLPTYSGVTISVFNTLGEKVTSLIDEFRPAGNYTVYWDAGDFPSGVYIIKMGARNESGSVVFTRVGKMVLVK